LSTDGQARRPERSSAFLYADFIISYSLKPS
jgi:hypothetical protein